MSTRKHTVQRPVESINKLDPLTSIEVFKIYKIFQPAREAGFLLLTFPQRGLRIRFGAIGLCQVLPGQ